MLQYFGLLCLGLTWQAGAQAQAEIAGLPSIGAGESRPEILHGGSSVVSEHCAPGTPGAENHRPDPAPCITPRTQERCVGASAHIDCMGYQDEDFEEHCAVDFGPFGENAYASASDPMHVYCDAQGSATQNAAILEDQLVATGSASAHADDGMSGQYGTASASASSRFTVAYELNVVSDYTLSGTIECSDASAGAEVVLRDSTGTAIHAFSVPYPHPEVHFHESGMLATGRYTLSASISASSGYEGNANGSFDVTLAFQELGPICDAGGLYDGEVGEPIIFDGSDSFDPDGIITSYWWDFGDAHTGSGPSPTHSYVNNAIYPVALCVTDDSGYTSCCETWANIGGIPTCDAGGPYAGNVGEPIAFDGTGSHDPGDYLASYDWQFGDGHTGTGAMPEHTYMAGGLHVVTLTITDDQAHVVSCETTADLNELPLCDNGGPYSGLSNEAISFYGTGSLDPDGTIVSYAWEFGDGATGGGPTTTHAYGTGGHYTVTLAIIDDRGADSDCVTVAIVTSSGWSDMTAPPLDDSSRGRGVAWGDYDSDGDLDLYLANAWVGNANRMFRNDDGMFVDASSGTPGTTDNTHGVAWGDIENDGDLDLYLCNASGSSNRLLRNDGGGTFADITSGYLGNPGIGRSVSWIDFNLDGDVDLYFANTDNSWGNVLLRNCGDQVFSVATSGPLSGMGYGEGAAWCDLDNDGDPDVYLANEGVNQLCRNDGDGIFVDIANGTPLADDSFTVGATWGDYDNDGDFDLYTSNKGDPNKLFRNDGTSGFADVTGASGPIGNGGNGRGVAWADHDLDGDLDLYIVNKGGANHLFSNDGGVFVDGTAGPLGDTGPGIGMAWADYDADGDPDIYLAQDLASNKLFRNDQMHENHWLQVDLVGTISNAAGIGARVQVTAPGLSLVREVTAGSGYISMNSLAAEFGLGEATVIDTVTVTWPAGGVEYVLQLAADQFMQITESGTTAIVDRALSTPVPILFKLHPNVPNPFNPITEIRYDLPLSLPVRLGIYDASGRLVRILVDTAKQEAGSYVVRWDTHGSIGRPVASGTYFCRLEAGTDRATRRLVLLK